MNSLFLGLGVIIFVIFVVFIYCSLVLSKR